MSKKITIHNFEGVITSEFLEKEFYERGENLKMPIKEKDKKATLRFMEEFGIDVSKIKVPDTVKTKGELYRWRKKIIDKNIDSFCRKEAPKPKLNRSKEVLLRVRRNLATDAGK